MTGTPEQPRPRLADDVVSTDELVRRHGIHPIISVDELAAPEDPFESDKEYEEFLADLYASRRADVA